MNSYYDLRLKEYRLSLLRSFPNFRFFKADIRNVSDLRMVFKECGAFDAVFHLAAMAGVRYSMRRPEEYVSVNVDGTLNILKLCQEFGVPKFVLASTSSLYAGQPLPFSEGLPVNEPISPYAASKKGAEALAYTYHYLYGIDVVVLRYFTVYGPAGRPDMSIFRFIYLVLKGIPLVIYGDGTQRRDFTYIDDIVEGTIRSLGISGYEVINLGSNAPHSLGEAISLIEELTGKKVLIEYKPAEKTDMPSTWANIEKAKRLLGWKPGTPLKEGLGKTIAWFKENWEWVKNIDIWREGW
ncbi:NAD-dependent epimerase/dehydratase family protein [Thermatribacter velox]|uniref:NAD-dependent epimerase/dehydratase family protein n=1 Tax=Thermatribacter velox TaxID=3039681 RepID=UPI0034D97FEB